MAYKTSSSKDGSPSWIGFGFSPVTSISVEIPVAIGAREIGFDFLIFFDSLVSLESWFFLVPLLLISFASVDSFLVSSPSWSSFESADSWDSLTSSRSFLLSTVSCTSSVSRLSLDFESLFWVEGGDDVDVGGVDPRVDCSKDNDGEFG